MKPSSDVSSVFGLFHQMLYSLCKTQESDSFWLLISSRCAFQQWFVVLDLGTSESCN